MELLRVYLLVACVISFICSGILAREGIINYKPIYIIASTLTTAATLGMVYIAFWIIS